jgi:FeS assembly SUF system regulator
LIRITRHTDYAIVLLARFAAEPEGTVRNARDLAEQCGLPSPMVSKVLKALARAGFLLSRRGSTGGYVLARPPSRISVAEVVCALEGPIAMTECLDHSTSVCSYEATCPSRSPWSKVNDAVRDALERVTLADMAAPVASPCSSHGVATATGAPCA